VRDQSAISGLVPRVRAVAITGGSRNPGEAERPDRSTGPGRAAFSKSTAAWVASLRAVGYTSARAGWDLRAVGVERREHLVQMASDRLAADGPLRADLPVGALGARVGATCASCALSLTPTAVLCGSSPVGAGSRPAHAAKPMPHLFSRCRAAFAAALSPRGGTVCRFGRTSRARCSLPPRSRSLKVRSCCSSGAGVCDLVVNTLASARERQCIVGAGRRIGRDA
jgi:hypothetical protein